MTEPKWLSGDEQRAWRAYQWMQSRLNARLNRQLQTDSSLSLADYEVLVVLSEVRNGRLRPFELQRTLFWEQSRLSHHLTRMQRRGLVAREGCTGDGRGALVVLTAAGREAIESAAPGHVAAVRRLFLDGLTSAQLSLLEELATTVLARLDTGVEALDNGSDPAAEDACAERAGAERAGAGPAPAPGQSA